MSKKKNKLKLEEKIMSQVKTGKITMKPKWYFVAGSLLLFSSFVALSIGVIFLINLTAFALRRHGPMAYWRLQVMIENFPWWMPILAFIGIILGIQLLKKYDFSYKKNLTLIIISFILAVLFAGFLIDRLGLNDYWGRKEPIRRFYKGLEPKNDFRKPGRRYK